MTRWSRFFAPSVFVGPTATNEPRTGEASSQETMGAPAPFDCSAVTINTCDHLAAIMNLEDEFVLDLNIEQLGCDRVTDLAWSSANFATA
jgi:hypothetical protein